MRTDLPRWLRVARALASLNLVGVVIAAPLVIIMMGYGLAHASGNDSAKFLMMVLGGTVLLGIMPLGVFAPRHWVASALLWAIGGLALLASSVVVGKITWVAVVEPMWLSHRFSTEMGRVVMEHVEHEPLQLHGVTAGMQLSVTLRLPADASDDRFGSSVEDLLRSSQLVTAKRMAGIGTIPFALTQARAKVWQGDRLIVETRERNVEGSRRTPALKAGIYRVTRTQWFWGLDGWDDSQPPCFDEIPMGDEASHALRGLDSVSVVAQASTRASLEMRRGYRDHVLRSKPFAVAYEHERWMQTLASLPLQSCKARAEAKRLAQAKAEAEAHKARYARGDMTLASQDNPLTKALCAKDLPAVRELLAAGVPNFSLSNMIHECGIGSHTPELFNLMMPLLYARESERTAYCHLLEPLLERRDTAALAHFHALGLPPTCATAGHFIRILGHINTMAALPAPQQLAWVKQLGAWGAPLCKASPDLNTLLQHAMQHGSEALLSHLMNQGCDPAVLPSFTLLEGQSARLLNVSARFIWRARVLRLKVGKEQLSGDLDLDGVARLTPRIGEVSDEEITRHHPRFGGNLLFMHPYGSGSMSEDALMIEWLASRGVRLDAADTSGRSWYGRGYAVTSPKRNFIRNHEVLNVLSVTQLQILIHPVVLSTGQPAQPMDALQDMAPGGLGEYLCLRKAIDC